MSRPAKPRKSPVAPPIDAPAAPPFRPKVALVLPHYGDISTASAMGFYNPTHGAVEVTLMMDSASSATPFAFNGLLAVALDARDRGDVTHLAMLHSDVGPAAGWVDVLHREMAGHDADLVSAVVPIKDKSGRTSTAIGALDDPWRPLRYVHANHRGLLPETFGPADVCRAGEVLMVNTGCMLIDLRRPWWDEPCAGGPGGDSFAFEFRTRIVKTPEGKRVAQFAPEDWLMSRHVQAAGGVVRATWAVGLEHRGSADWSNAG